MENNNYNHEEFDNCFLCKHPALKTVLTGLLIFFGAFCAFYIVSDWHFKRMLSPYVQMKNFDKMFQKQEMDFENNFRSDMIKNRMGNSQFIRVEKLSNAYRIVIDLRPFDNDERNVEIKAEGNTLIVNAVGTKANRNKQEIIKYSQAFAFGEKIDSDEITKVKQGYNYIITVPFE